MSLLRVQQALELAVQEQGQINSPHCTRCCGVMGPPVAYRTSGSPDGWVAGNHLSGACCVMSGSVRRQRQKLLLECDFTS